MKTSNTSTTPGEPGTQSRFSRIASSRAFRRGAGLYVIAVVLAYMLSAYFSDPQAEVGASIIFFYAGLPWSLLPLSLLSDSASDALAIPGLVIPAMVGTALVNATLVGLLANKIAGRPRVVAEARSSRVLYYLLSIVAAGVLFPGAYRTMVTAATPSAGVPSHWLGTLNGTPPENIGIENRDGVAVYVYDPANEPPYAFTCDGGCYFHPLEPAGPGEDLSEVTYDGVARPPFYDIPVIERVEMPLGQRVPYAVLAYGLPTALITYGLILLTRLLKRISKDPSVFNAGGATALRRMRNLAITVGVSLTLAEFFKPQASSGATFDLSFTPFIVAAGFSVLAYIWRAGDGLRAEAEGMV